MFFDFFFTLRANKIPVTIGEFLDFMKVLQTNTVREENFSFQQFYLVARLCLIKDVKYYHSYDKVFAECFSSFMNMSEDNSFRAKLLQWLEQSLAEKPQGAGSLPPTQYLPEDLMKELEKRWREQQERHDGGNRWIGRWGTSPFGHSGQNPAGVRVGGVSQSRSALAVAMGRDYNEYRTDLALNIRQIKVCLKKLRTLKKEGRKEFSFEKTLSKTCQNAGEIEICVEASRKNTMRLLLLMDVGGSMTPYAKMVGELFSACHQMNHFKEFHSYYFHNIFYDYVYKKAQLREPYAVDELLRNQHPHTRIIIVGDAAMAPYELFTMNQEMMEYYQYFGIERRTTSSSSKKTGYERVMQLKKNFPYLIWINPEPIEMWNSQTTKSIKNLVPMFFLGLDGLQKGIQHLKNASVYT